MKHIDHAASSRACQQSAGDASRRGMNDLAESQMVMAQWHATMAIYELSLEAQEDRHEGG